VAFARPIIRHAGAALFRDRPGESSLRNIVEILLHHADASPARPAYRFFQGSSLAPDTLTFAEIGRLARALAARLQAEGLTGASALLVCKQQKHFVLAFYACLLAGVIAVPTAPPRRTSLRGRLDLLARDAGVRVLISDVDEMLAQADEVIGRPVLSFDVRRCLEDGAVDSFAAAWKMPSLRAETVAFLQYTSGSTGDPKGVMVGHGNLMQNCSVIQPAMDWNRETSILTALPLFHDMGLVGGVLESMFIGCVANCMPPAEFVQYPERWLQLIAKFGITISGGPNFMYDLASRVVTDEQIAGCDLSGWRVAFCGAEPIRASTIRRFTERFGAFGFRPQSFFPCYGMAEATLYISGVAMDSLPKIDLREGNAVVGCGRTNGDTELVIVDPETRQRMPEEQTGEIWVRGGSVAQGYWQRPELNARVFQATIAGDEGKCYLRTGDLGYLKAGELYVAGRLKDLIILYGKKYAPQDIEDTTQNAHPALRADACIALAINETDVERLVVVCELKREWLRRDDAWPEIVTAVRRAVSAQHGINVDEVVFIKPGTLPRTSSGKVRRAQTRADFTSKALELALPLRSAEPAPA
jgi:acyl-CoA synthetase (AMP-forming)/AMP-acid ligase II